MHKQSYQSSPTLSNYNPIGHQIPHESIPKPTSPTTVDPAFLGNQTAHSLANSKAAEPPSFDGRNRSATCICSQPKGGVNHF
ncbi:hypothetical protein DSO57_1016326 [Entomophthora muscae]|uniref:Uncharacterized protein n=2 Tax=Entomophthora muscae TaxID=34485 RepID=A0ACC2STR5_9FUNG|nr:hypothetical protein DSO57_1017406 [Entomophthora muscae]KAJ9073455.1 hypothetical protein DSO57_1016326 [Entomophthora muscae]